MFCGGLRTLRIPHRLVGASEPLPFCRALVHAVHHQLPAHAFPHDAASPAATVHASTSHLAFWGFPCGPSSGLRRHLSPDTHDELLTLLDSALDYVRLHQPPVFLLENIPALLGRHRWVLDRLLSLLTASDMPTYEWYWDVICPTEFGGVFSRPRLFLLGWIPIP